MKEILADLLSNLTNVQWRVRESRYCEKLMILDLFFQTYTLDMAGLML